MSRSVQAVLLAILAGAVVSGASARGAPARPDTTLCKQIPGPHAEYLSLVSGFKSKGNTWTVLATKRVSCGLALAKTPALLGRWVSAPIGGRLPLAGYTCTKMKDSGYSGTGVSSGGFLCHRGTRPATSPFAPDTFAARETTPYTPAQIRALFGIR